MRNKFFTARRFAFCSTNGRKTKSCLRVRTCVIFNPMARGNKARHFRHWLDSAAKECALKPTKCAGDARRLGQEAVRENFELVIAAGGDGTVNEVLNGIGDVPSGFENTRLGVLPLGTVNVFARELCLPLKIADTWNILRRGKEKRIDLPVVEFMTDGKKDRRYFAQLAGAGLDARAIELVSWKHKKKVGPLAYVIAGLKALREPQPRIKVRADGREVSGELVLTGNGRFYGGSFAVFPDAELSNGLLEVCCVPRADFLTLLRCAPGVLFQQRLPEKAIHRLSVKTFELTSETKAAFELDGEWVGYLPAKFSVGTERLRVLVP
jgi:diacylglycerol kinase (ATP)